MRAMMSYSYSAEIDFGSWKNKEFYDAETGTMVIDEGGKRNITTFALKNGKLSMDSVYYNDEAKVYAPFTSGVRDAAEVEPITSGNVVVWQGRWCIQTQDAIQDIETGITLVDNCTHTKTINIKLGPQPKDVFKIPADYKKVGLLQAM